MLELFLIIGVLIAVFVGFNIGGSSAGICWGVPVGAEVITKNWAALLFTFFVFLGGWTVGRRVIDTLGRGLVPSDMFTLQASIMILLFIGLGILIANLYGVPVPTSMTAVGSIAGLGLATGTLNWEILGRIVTWWLVTPVIAFWAGAVTGRYIYPYLERYFKSEKSKGPILDIGWSGVKPKIKLGPNTTYQEIISITIVIAIGCFMAFSAGASNVPNAVAPLVGSGELGENPAIIIATLAIGLGGFTIARRTMDSVGNDLTELPLLAAVIVAVVAATITTGLSYIGIPISLVMGTVMTIVGLGWGRASRVATVKQVATGEQEVDLTINPLLAEQPKKVAKIGEEKIEDIDTGERLVRPKAIAKFVSLWIIGPTVSAGLSYAFFTLTLI
ncbi:inorganic phosphate transporter [Methanonatronarchaeum sp. AMET-Sl]|uniref:inorganic phosphate transporter n=1 Tax=Methanonatronarchaeum sp. AMET-Sl TaxID=3037654 RepID=UPI00244E08F3|nr:inorganic phosphate transporter [Methanonatronarchaeum sp. AMET-Sl]WGI17821.1 inorganic phosphate transporter [Methanonatronarchaeum sp. AMET-Sl]